MGDEPHYDDGRIRCDASALTIGWYYFWGSKRIEYKDIRSTKVYEMGALRGKWRIWGSGDLVHWYNLDGKRPSKQRAIELDTGGHVRPCITPDDVDAVAGIIAERRGG